MNSTIKFAVLIMKSQNYYNSGFKLTSKAKSFNNCKLCSFQVNQNIASNSKKRDVILTIGINNITNILLFARTLRTSGSRCRLILFTNDQVFQRYEKKFFDSIYECGVEIINIGKTSSNFYAKSIRFIIFRDFLTQNRDLFDRVILCDLFDTVFQHDPFLTELGNSLYFNDEGMLISESYVNSAWIRKGFQSWKKNFDPDLKFDGTLRRNIRKKSVICSGVQVGPIDLMIKFCDAMSRSVNNKTFQPYFEHDQAFLNMLIHSGFLQNKINYTIVNPNNNLFTSIAFFISKINSGKFVFGNISRDGGIPAIVHQFDRSEKLCCLVSKVCPNENNFYDYSRCKFAC